MLLFAVPLPIAGNTPSVLPEPERNRQRIDVERDPPRTLVTLPVKLAMVHATQRNRELV
jgi:hypothetical protein